MEQDIITDLTVLQSSLNKLIVRTEQSDFTLQQFRAFQLTLFALNSLPEIIEYVLSETKLFFALESSNLILIDAEAKVAGYLSESHYDYQKNQALVLLSSKAGLGDVVTSGIFIGQYTEQLAALFPVQTEQPVEVIIIPLIQHGEYLGSINLSSGKKNALPNKTHLDFVQQIASCISLCLENQLNFAIAQQAYRTEALAKTNNRYFLEQRLTEEIERGQRATSSLSCVLCEVSFPLLENNRNKLQLEAQVLQTAAETIRRQLRLADVFSYYEGKKFAAFLSNVPESVVAEITQRINTAIEEQVINFSQKIIPLSVIFGSASYQITASAEKSPNALALELLSAADAKLYAAKYNNVTSAKKEKAA